MKTLAVISILALLTISGAAYTDRTSKGRSADRARGGLNRLLRGLRGHWGYLGDDSDAFGGPIPETDKTCPAVVAAFLIASQISGGVTSRTAPVGEMASE